MYNSNSFGLKNKYIRIPMCRNFFSVIIMGADLYGWWMGWEGCLSRIAMERWLDESGLIVYFFNNLASKIVNSGDKNQLSTNHEAVTYLKFILQLLVCVAEPYVFHIYRSYYQPWKDRSLELTDLQKMEEHHACQSLLVIFSNALQVSSVELSGLSRRDVQESGLFAWEKNIVLRTQECVGMSDAPESPSYLTQQEGSLHCFSWSSWNAVLQFYSFFLLQISSAAAECPIGYRHKGRHPSIQLTYCYSDVFGICEA